MSQDCEFIHGINPSNWLACYNLKLRPLLSSPDVMAKQDSGLEAQHQSLRTVPLERLKDVPFPPGVVTPRVGLNLIPGAVIESGGHVGVGGDQTKWLSADQEKHIHRIWKVELDFEKRRRELTPEAASRLSCLWLAEDTEVGRSCIKSMFVPDLSILQVKIVESLRLTRVDTAWFDRYFESGDEAFLDAYWRGTALNSNAPRWEYLLEGSIQFDSAKIDHLLSMASQLPSWPDGLPRS